MDGYTSTTMDQVQNQRLDVVERKCDTANVSIGSMGTDIAVIKTDISWIKGLQWLVLTASVSSVIAAVVDLVFRWK